MSGYVTNIESDTLANEDYRRVLFTGPAGVEHNVINTSRNEPLRIYTLYSPPEHPTGTIHRTKLDETGR